MDTLKRFFSEYKHVKLTSDCEPSFRSHVVLSMLKEHGDSVQYVSDNNHSKLAIIDRFIRTIRDSKPYNEPFTPLEMKTFVDKYNHKVHSSTGYTPHDMMYNDGRHEKENEYIHKMCLKLKNPDGLRPGDHVKVTKQYGKLDKRRSQYTHHAYILGNLRGGLYEVKALDDTYTLVPRWRLIKLKEPIKSPIAVSMTDFKKDGALGERINERKGKPKIIHGRIVGYNEKNKRYIVSDNNKRSDYTYEIGVKNYRGDHPLTPSPHEQQFINKNKLNIILDQ